MEFDDDAGVAVPGAMPPSWDARGEIFSPKNISISMLSCFNDEISLSWEEMIDTDLFDALSWVDFLKAKFFYSVAMLGSCFAMQLPTKAKK